MLSAEFEGRRLVPTRAAYRELEERDWGLADVVEVLEQGFDCSPSKRAHGILERCLRFGEKVRRVVVAEDTSHQPDGFEESVWLVIHASEESWKKTRWR